jgi:nicotinamidase-related amidase
VLEGNIAILDAMSRRRAENGDGDLTALIVTDMLNTYEHEDADALAESVARTLDPIRALIGFARGRDLPLIYVNDNYGDWNSSSEELAKRAMAGGRPDLVEPVLPPNGSKFVIKARHTIFYETPLNYLLTQLGVGSIVLVGQVTEQCILYSALDAYVRHLEVAVPPDAVAHIHEDLADAALRMMERNMNARLVSSDLPEELFSQ